VEGLAMQDFESIVKRVLERTSIGYAELLNRIRKKREELGIVTLEGAARMVGKELGVEDDG